MHQGVFSTVGHIMIHLVSFDIMSTSGGYHDSHVRAN